MSLRPENSFATRLAPTSTKKRSLSTFRCNAPVRRSRFHADLIAATLKRIELGERAEDLADELGVSVRTIYRWRERGAPLAAHSSARVAELEGEILRLQKINAQQVEDIAALSAALVGRYDSIADRRRIIEGFIREHQMSERHACDLVDLSRSTKRYRSTQR
ncbi:MAG: hypothetical protein EA402_06040 [Planctomycetota bacterium]|nr:MAG: hypothetical protein EA402_06040 [Planctomycetota bacterium]